MKVINYRVQRALFEIPPAALFTTIILINHYSIGNETTRTFLPPIALLVVIACAILVKKLNHEVQDERTKDSIHKAGDYSFRITLLSILLYTFAIYIHAVNPAPLLPFMAVSYSVLKVIDVTTFCILDKIQ